MTNAKIICTLGPASNKIIVLLKMMRAGMDMARLNFSHGSLQECRDNIQLVRELNKKYARHVRILGDLEGNRIRIGRLRKPIELKKNQVIYLTQKKVIGTREIISFDYAGDLKAIKARQDIYIDDGNIVLLVEGRGKSNLKTRVIIGGLLKERKGLNIPGARLEFPVITEKDKMDILFCISHNLDYVAQSFVRTKEDILKIKSLISRGLPKCKLIAKIENREGIKNIDEIIDASDGIMIARGDMGVSIPIYEVPIVQKQIIRKCNRAGKFVITATQMLESMTENPRPTRAEVSDVANAVIDGSDYLMLSAETSVGAHPAEAVKTMSQVIQFTERHIGQHVRKIF
ncbi:MAG: pyruvate kinase [Candidatus Omnitrophica bacterium CG07_land_8_20_14_0_80_42_15]|uniref:Pyruvate kinase n=1 Tax=Candidatus Aquitaenariimonas noxiae TaxID=1974741 RepID=A0A2J0KY70_9BACT|nr:MAG: pyruvate kinase [Candidatus Omnitrophica bacterium CG07_land_8_20_14_0_80_42_15]